MTLVSRSEAEARGPQGREGRRLSLLGPPWQSTAGWQLQQQALIFRRFWKSETQVPACLVPGDSSFPGLSTAVPSSHLHLACPRGVHMGTATEPRRDGGRGLLPVKATEPIASPPWDLV